MTTERRPTYFALLWRDCYRTFLQKPQKLGVDAGQLLQSWLFLVRWVIICAFRTLRFAWVCSVFLIEVLAPIPRGEVDRYRPRATGLPIPAMEMSLFVFGSLAAASYFLVT